jgi:dihydropteroate synthase
MKTNTTIPTVFNNRKLININGRIVDFSIPKIMGILNVTPDSFFDGGKFTEQKAIIKQVSKMLAEGADIIDVGAQSSRPGAKFISEKTELNRVLPAIQAITGKFPQAIISIDTFRSKVAEKCMAAGAHIINDISGGDFDKNMFEMVAKLQVPYILMHIKGKPETMQIKPKYKDVVSEIFDSLGSKVAKLRKSGVHDVIVDPGFGFGKTVEQNYKLLKSLSVFNELDCPVLAGISRKSMICKVLQVNPDKALNGTTALHMAALLAGASLLRVHDVKEAREVVQLFLQLK